MHLTLYGHRLSQPCRAVEILLRELAVAYTWHEVDFANGQTRQAWFARHINPLRTIPALAVTDGQDNDNAPASVLAESHAILRYLCRTAQAQDTARRWYPADRDAQQAGRVDLWMAWHHNNIRRHDMFHDIMNLHCTLPMLKYEIQANALKPLQDALNASLTTLEQHFAGQASQQHSAPTLAGGAHPTLADLTMTCELYQLVAVGYRFDRYPLVSRWLAHMAQRKLFGDVSEPIITQGQTIREQSGGYLDLARAFA